MKKGTKKILKKKRGYNKEKKKALDKKKNNNTLEYKCKGKVWTMKREREREDECKKDIMRDKELNKISKSINKNSKKKKNEIQVLHFFVK